MLMHSDSGHALATRRHSAKMRQNRARLSSTLNFPLKQSYCHNNSKKETTISLLLIISAVWFVRRFFQLLLH